MGPRVYSSSLNRTLPFTKYWKNPTKNMQMGHRLIDGGIDWLMVKGQLKTFIWKKRKIFQTQSMEHLCMYTYVYMLGSTTASHAQQKESQEFNYIKGRMSLDHVFKKNVQSECTYLVVLAIAWLWDCSIFLFFLLRWRTRQPMGVFTPSSLLFNNWRWLESGLLNIFSISWEI
jgi:hypothetical protein